MRWPALLMLGYLVIHLALVSFARFPPPRQLQTQIIDLLLMAGVILLLLIPAPDWALIWLPLLFFWWAYFWAGKTLTAIHPPERRFDHTLIEIEGAWLGQPSLRWGLGDRPLLTEFLHFCYFSYYFYSVFLAVYLHLSGRFSDLAEFVTAVVFGYFVAYTCFALIPVWGPRWSLSEAGLPGSDHQRQSGYLFTRLIHKIMFQGVAHKGGAMPSSHSSTALIFLYWCWQLWGWAGGLPASILVVGMWIGSIYGRYHFVSDVLAGIVLGVAGILFAALLV